MTASITLPLAMIDAMIAHARDDAPNECCGIIAGKDGRPTRLYQLKNAAEKAYLPFRYEIDGKDLLALIRELDGRGEEFFVIYHSHTGTEAYPSPTDVRFAANWPDPWYVLVSLMDPASPILRGFRITGGEITEHPIEIA